MRRFFSILLVAGMSTLLPADGQAALVLTENFNYGSSDLGGGYGSWEDGTGRARYQPGVDLTFANASYSNTGNTASTGTLEIIGGSGDPRGAGLEVSSTGLTGEVWVSSLIRFVNGTASTNRTLFLGFSDESYSNAGPQGDAFGLGYDSSGDIAPVFRDNSPSGYTFGSDTSFSTNTNYLLVAKLNINASADDSFSYWLLKEGDTFGATEASLGTADLTSTSADFGDGLTNIWGGRDIQGTGAFDAIRISTTSGDAGLSEVLTAVPEPSSALLITAGLIALAAHRRRLSGH